MQLLLWITDGLFAGWLTAKLMSAEGRDYVMDIIMGIAGAVGGGFIANALGLPGHGKMIYTNLAAILGAVILTVLSRFFGRRREYASTD